jgi:hypothetical protein
MSSWVHEQVNIQSVDGLHAERLKNNSDVFTPLHDPTTQIRLLQLDPASTREHITASLQTWDKSSSPAFNAVSYVCGEALPENIIRINGSAFYVGDNCFYALRQVTLRYPRSYVWIDAICINQQNLAEKSAQVSAMGDIYRASSKVLACIGQSDAISDEIARVTEYLDSFVQEFPPEWRDPGAYRVTGP